MQTALLAAALVKSGRACQALGSSWKGLGAVSGLSCTARHCQVSSVKCQVSGVRLVSGTNKLDTDCWLQADAPDL